MPGYYPNNYNSYFTGTQPGVTQANPAPMTAIPINSFSAVLVDGEASARAYPVAAGNTVILMDFNGGHFWFKSTDTTGMPQQLRVFDFKETTQQTSQPAPAVSREEFNSLSEKLDKLIAELGGK